MARVRLFLHFLAFACLTLPSFASDWQQPTPDELKMTAEPSAPNASAVYLYREETTDDKLHMHSMYVRLKILNDAGKDYGDVEIFGGNAFYNITDIQGRTIHSDGSVVPFTGKPYEKLIAKTGNLRYKAKVFSLPDVQNGSILEYRYKLRYEDNEVISPDWEIQQQVYVRKAHYHFVPTDRDVISSTDHGNVSSTLAYSQLLPKGVAIKETRGTYDLDVSNIPALPDEQFMPPMRAFSYRVRFYYTGYRTVDEFWTAYGKTWSRQMEKFEAPSPFIREAAQEITSGAPDQTAKLEKLYAAVMKLENTSFTRERTSEENKAEGVKRVKSAQDVWTLKRGGSDDLTLLFISLARGAGFKAYASAVVNRDRDMFQQSFLNGNQLDDLLAVVEVDGKEKYFDPGQRYCAFGQLDWKHTYAGGIRQTDGHTALITTPGPSYKDTQIQRVADLTIDGHGELKGTATLVYTGAAALRWRHRALESDEADVKKEFADSIQADLPPGVLVKTNHFVGLDRYDTVLIAILDVSGAMGAGTQKRIFLPASFFEASSHSMFPQAKRENPVDLHYPYASKDEVTLHLPAGMTVESAPAPANISFPHMALLQTSSKTVAETLTYTRTFIMANTLYEAKEYPELKGFMDKVTAKDQDQAVLQTLPQSALAGAGK